MADVNFIEFGTQPFFIERTSPYTKRREVFGVRLLPNNELPYIQITNINGGIELEDWTVYVVNCNVVETDVTDYFVIENVFTDNNGDNQFVWSLTNVPFDFGYNLISLKVTQTIGETFYSNWFMITDYKSNETIRVDYRSYNQDVMQSVQLPMAFKQEFNPIEIETYYETTTKHTVINTVKQQSYESWLTKIISNDLLLKIIKVFTYKYTYVNLLRCNLFEAIEQKEYTADENFNENVIKLTFNKSDVYNPLTADIPVVEPLLPIINLTSVVPNGITATYNFSIANFNPDYLVFGYSSDAINWVQSTNNFTSPQLVSFNGTGTWYFRITHPEAISNIIQLDLSETVIAVNDSINVEKGATIDISSLLNDTLVGTTTITSVTTPTNGTATIIDGGTKIRYVHDDSLTTSDSFNYTISNGITSDTATINLVIVSSGTSTMFSMSSLGPTSEKACLRELSLVKWHNGLSLFPQINDYVYNDAALTDAFIGVEGYFAIYRGQWIQINEYGKVIDKGFC